MPRPFIPIAAFLALSVSSGCGGDGSGGGGTSGGGAGGEGGTGGAGGATIDAAVDEGVVLDAAVDALSAAEIAIGGDGEGGAVELADVGTSAVNIVLIPESQKSAAVSPKQGTGCDCTENSCAFTDCSTGGGLVLNGTISWTETSLDCDYMVSGNQAGTTYSFTIFCDLDFTPTSLDGQLSTSGTVDMAGAASAWDTDLTFNNITYVGGQPVGGSIDVTASVTVNGQTYTSTETVSF